MLAGAFLGCAACTSVQSVLRRETCNTIPRNPVDPFGISIISHDALFGKVACKASLKPDLGESSSSLDRPELYVGWTVATLCWTDQDYMLLDGP